LAYLQATWPPWGSRGWGSRRWS